MTKAGWATLLLCGILVVSIAGCGPQPDAVDTTDAGTAVVTRGSLTVEVTASGNLAFSREENLAFEMAGTVEEVLVKTGDSVTEGQVVATLDTSQWERQIRNLRIALLQAQIGLDQADYALEQAKTTTSVSITGDVVIRQERDDRDIAIKEMQVEVAQERVKDAEVALDDALALSPTLVAPFDGFITRVNAEGGDEVMKGHVAATIADATRFEALILVNENDISDVAAGTPATVAIDAQPGVVLPAEVIDVSPTATIQAGVVNYQVKVELTPLEEMAGSGQTGSLREGLSVSVTLITAEKSDILLVPNSAISGSPGRFTVTVIGEDGTGEMRQVATGISNWQFTEVLSGLEEGEVVETVGAAPGATAPSLPGGTIFPGRTAVQPAR